MTFNWRARNGDLCSNLSKKKVLINAYSDCIKYQQENENYLKRKQVIRRMFMGRLILDGE